MDQVWEAVRRVAVSGGAVGTAALAAAGEGVAVGAEEEVELGRGRCARRRWVGLGMLRS